MERRLIECVPNFSEGRNRRAVERIAAAMEQAPGVTVLDCSLDPDHHRAVITLAGEPAGVVEAAVRGVEQAVREIDLTRHQGVHPRIGAADVVPFVPLEGVTLEECVELAWEAGRKIWSRCGVPVYFYEAAARRADRRRLEAVRRGQFEKLRELAPQDPTRRPDVGGPHLHPTAGATAVAARPFLIAYNVNLASTDLEAARRIAQRIRASSGGFPHVKAMGVPLATRGMVQVSMNFTDFERTPLEAVLATIEREAATAGIPIAECELVGLIPRRAFQKAPAVFERCRNFGPDRILENRLEWLANPRELESK